MASENETVADILNEMRVFGRASVMAKTMLHLADRTEAAHKRELAELCECLKEAVAYFCGHDKADCTEKVYGHPSCETEGQHCMVERWRKALEGAKDGK